MDESSAFANFKNALNGFLGFNFCLYIYKGSVLLQAQGFGLVSPDSPVVGWVMRLVNRGFHCTRIMSSSGVRRGPEVVVNAPLSLQDAIRGEHGRDFMGANIVVEWARGPKVR